MEDTEFDGGFYHGVIKLPNSYPLKPPNIMFLTVIKNNLHIKFKILLKL
jgi:ubiquitin-conjugating enzyme E2 J1